MITTIVIPARYASTRLPGKPLVQIAGQTMLQRVVELSRAAIHGLSQASVVVATDDERILKHCRELNVEALMTPAALPTGTDRVAFAIQQMNKTPDFIINMQGDAPLTPPDFLRALIDAFSNSSCDAVTPVTRLTWQELERLRQNKLTTPFSGTTVTFDENNGRAFWFSKNIIPAIRNESMLITKSSLSPVFRHIGLYGYSYDMLMRYNQLPESTYEGLEGLEQLRLIENGYHIRCVPVHYCGRPSMSGVDSPEDVIRTESLLAQHEKSL